MRRIATYDKHRKTTRLHFPDDDHPSLELYMRGGIAWPALIREQGGEIIGHLIMVGMDVATSEYYIEDEAEFVAVEHVTGIDRYGCESIEQVGACDFFNRMFNDYYADHYYYHDHKETQKHYSREILRSAMIRPKPHMMHTAWAEKEQIDRMMFELMATDRLIYGDGTPIHKALTMYEANREYVPPPVRALHACIAGMVRAPWKAPAEEKIVYKWMRR